MEIFLLAFHDTAVLLLRILPTMFAGLFGVEVLMQLGLMKKLEPVGKPLVRMSNLPSQCIPAFLTSIGSLIAANAMLAGHHEDGTITDREMVIGAVFNTVPLHFKETLTYQLPVILPLLGPRLCLIYICVFWLSGFLKLGYVIVQGKRELSQRKISLPETLPQKTVSGPKWKKILDVIRIAFDTRKALFFRMTKILVIVTFIIQVLVHAGVLKTVELLIGPFADMFQLPTAVIAPVSIYIFSPIVGISAMSTLLHEKIVTEYQVIVALLAGGFLMVPVMRLRGTLPRYVSIFGWKHGSSIIYITTVLSLVSRGIVLAGVLLFYS